MGRALNVENGHGRVDCMNISPDESRVRRQLTGSPGRPTLLHWGLHMCEQVHAGVRRMPRCKIQRSSFSQYFFIVRVCLVGRSWGGAGGAESSMAMGAGMGGVETRTCELRFTVGSDWMRFHRKL